MRIVGGDVWKKGWVTFTIEDGLVGEAATFDVVSDLVIAHSYGVVIALDIPIGLPEEPPREADVEARSFVGARRSSVFPAPPRDVLKAETYKEASSRSQERYGRGLSPFSWSTFDEGPAVLPGDSVLDAKPSAAPPGATVIFGEGEGEGEGGLWSVAEADAATVTTLERREEFVTNTSAKDSVTLFRAISHRLEVTEKRGEQFSIDLTDDGDPLPWLDMRPQDRMRAHLPQDATGRDVVASDVYRVAAMTARLTGGGRQQAYVVDFGRYQLRADRLRDLLMARLLGRVDHHGRNDRRGRSSRPRLVGPPAQ